MTADEPMTEVVPEAADARRACALLMHYAEGNAAGTCAVLLEAAHAERLVELLLQVLHVTLLAQPELRSERGLGWLQESVLLLAAQEHADRPPFRPLRNW